MGINTLYLQAERLSEFYEVCKSLDVGRGERFIKIEQVRNLHLWCLLKQSFLSLNPHEFSLKSNFFWCLC